MNVTAADIGALLGNNNTFSNLTVWCKTFYPNENCNLDKER